MTSEMAKRNKREYNKRHYEEHKEHYRKIRREYYLKNKDRLLAQSKKWILENKEKRSIIAKRWEISHPEVRRRHNGKARKIVLSHYGNKCTCCGEETPEFLCIDHVNNDGAEQRKKYGLQGNNFYRWVIKKNFPKDLQVLCHNCNMAKSFYGQCPHQREKGNG